MESWKIALIVLWVFCAVFLSVYLTIFLTIAGLLAYGGVVAISKLKHTKDKENN